MKKVFVLALVGAVLLTTGIVFAAESQMWGRVESVDGNTIKVSSKRLGDATIEVDAGTKITINGESASISDVTAPSGIRGTVEEISENTYKGIELDFRSNCPEGVDPGSFVGGRVVSVDESSRTIVVNRRRDEEITVKLTADAKIEKAGAEVSISEIEVDDRVRFEADEQSDGTYLATFAEIGEPRGGPSDGSRGGRGERPVDGTRPFIGGQIVSVDVANRTFVLSNPRSDEDVTVKLTADAVVTKDGEEISLSDIKADEFIHFKAEKQEDGTFLASSGNVGQPEGRPEKGSRGGRGGNKGGNGNAGTGGTRGGMRTGMINF